MKNFLKKTAARTALVSLLVWTLILPWPSLLWAAEMTVKREKELGERFHLKIAAAGVLLDDPISSEYFKKVTDRVMRGAGLKPGQFRFYIVNSDGINAFAVPGGYIYMHSETIISLENEGQLASILGHEVAHITSRHFARRVEASSTFSLAYLAAMLAGMALASQGGGGSAAALGQALMIGGAGATIQAMLANSRDDEAEADAKGRRILGKAGYNLRDMYGAFKIMSEKTYQTSPDMPGYLSTHPALTSRLATTFRDLQDSPPSPADPAYRAFSDRIMALTGEPRRVQNVMGKRLSANKNDASALHALGLLAARQQNLTGADKLMKRALAQASNNREYLADLGDLAIRRRKPEEARGYFEKAGQNSRQAVLGLARASELLGNKNRAATLYDQAVAMSAEASPEALELAGRFFGNAGQMGKGHYYLAKYFAALGNLERAIFHYKEVAKQPDAGGFKAAAKREADYLAEIQKEDKK